MRFERGRKTSFFFLHFFCFSTLRLLRVSAASPGGLQRPRLRRPRRQGQEERQRWRQEPLLLLLPLSASFLLLLLRALPPSASERQQWPPHRKRARSPARSPQPARPREPAGAPGAAERLPEAPEKGRRRRKDQEGRRTSQGPRAARMGGEQQPRCPRLRLLRPPQGGGTSLGGRGSPTGTRP